MFHVEQSALSASQISALLTPYLPEVPDGIATQLAVYLDLLLRWNARTNLTAIREPEEIVRRHFGESLFCGLHVGRQTETLLDLGSGAGFPGLPTALLRPEIAVTLAESQNKKATFLREAVRTLQLGDVEVWAGRAEALPETRRFDTVTLRAVDNMAVALVAAVPRAAREILVLGSTVPGFPSDFALQPPIPIPGGQASFLFRAVRG
ncbi:16S rRNA (guanine(527)-N(7))-methyltransferase RsmG [Edaphobacter sp.]|uniref:16S rRNA (guanine(527)-N(7))-methyltransferase RsmG n=1 Tax=Edaphobacter sp. TaxID=1934404 RepID=UPI0039C8A963